MYTKLLVLIISVTTINADNNCCSNANVVNLTSKTCQDGSNIKPMECDARVVFGPYQAAPADIELDSDGILIVKDEKYMGYIKIQPEKFCLTKNANNDKDIAITCIEVNQIVYPTTKAVALMFAKSGCAFISVLFLLAVIIVYCSFRSLRDIEGNAILNFTLFLTIAHVVIVIIPLVRYIYPTACSTTGFLYFLSMMTSYNWLTVLSFHLYRIAVKPAFRPNINWMLVYCIYGYAVPIGLLATALVYHFYHLGEEEIGDFQCWAEAGNPLVWSYFYGPTMIMVLFSAVLQFLVAKKIWLGAGRNSAPGNARLRKKSLMYMHLLLIMTLRKIMDIMTYVYLSRIMTLDYVWQVSDCRNLLTGGAVFIILVVLRNRVLNTLANGGLCCVKFPEKWKKFVELETEWYAEEPPQRQNNT